MSRDPGHDGAAAASREAATGAVLGGEAGGQRAPPGLRPRHGPHLHRHRLMDREVRQAFVYET